MAVLTTDKKYLDQNGLSKFYGIIKGQWELADSKLKEDLEGKLAEAVEALEAEDTALSERIDTEVAALQQADEALGQRIDAIVASGADFDVISKEWKVNNVATDDKVLSLTQVTKYVDSEGNVTDTKPEGEGLYHEFSYGTLSSTLGLDATSQGETLTIALKGKDGEVIDSKEVDLSSIVLDNYINSITYHHTAEEGVEDLPAAPYIKFVWNVDSNEEGAEAQVLRVSVADLVSNVAGTDGEIEVATTQAEGDNKETVQTISIAQAFKDKIWGTATDSSFQTVNAAIAAETKEREDKDAEITKALGDHKTEFETYKNEQAAKDQAQDKALTDHEAAFTAYKEEQATRDNAQNDRLDALELANTTNTNNQAAKDKEQDDRLGAIESWIDKAGVLTDAEIEAICGVSSGTSTETPAV